jgi:ribosomal protein S18 acetylase RimI-like enzyme
MAPTLDLANIVWRTLSGSHAHFAAGTGSIRRYARGYTPLIGFADLSSPPFEALAPFCDVGERFYCAEWRGAAPRGWSVEMDSTMCAMLWNGAPPPEDPALGAVRLGPEHVAQMMTLAAVTRPGPFAERTAELGAFHGIVEDGELVAMAGERMHAGKLREVSGICTAPAHQGRGFGRRLTQLVIRRQLARGETPFLHVMSANTRARELYERLGFRVDREVTVRVVFRTG